MPTALLIALSLAACGAVSDPQALCASVDDADRGRCLLLSSCGNGSPDPGEECDDGNTANGDGCSSTCQIEECDFICTPPIPGTPDVNLIADGSFEDSNLTDVWTLDHSLFGELICGDNCFGSPLASDLDGNIASGNFVLVAGGSFTSASSGFVEHQSIVFPAEAETLIFNWGLGTPGTACPDANDGLQLLIDGQAVWSSTDAGDCGPVPLYTVTSVDLGALGINDGASHTIRFEGTASVVPTQDDLANIFLDQIRILVPPENPQPPIPSMCTPIICGDRLQVADEQCDDGNVNDGDGCSALCEVEQPDFVCTDALPPGVDSNAVPDGAFESGRNGVWTTAGTEFNPLCSQALCGPTKAQSGAFYAWFGGRDVPGSQSISQSFSIPSTATSLEFALEITACDSIEDVLSIQIDGENIFVRNCDGVQTSRIESVDISAYADDRTHKLSIIGDMAAAGGMSSFFIDDLLINTNAPFDGAPSACTPLPVACNTPELFTTGIPANWTVVNLSPNVNDGWGTSDDGVCGYGNWAGGNVTGGGGTAACADSDGTGQFDIDNVGGGTPLPMDTYLCTPSLDVANVTDPVLSFLVNYQTRDNRPDDNGTPADPSDDFDADFLHLVVGNEPPTARSVVNYTSAGSILDHLDASLEFSLSAIRNAPLSDYQHDDEVYVCFHYVGTYDWYAQIDNVALRGRVCEAPVDADLDGITDDVDNCTSLPNPDQIDTDGDDHGNRCDADFNNDCSVNAVDIGILRTLFFQAGNQADLNGDGIVSVTDLGLFRTLFFSPPGPSANGLCDDLQERHIR